MPKPAVRSLAILIVAGAGAQTPVVPASPSPRGGDAIIRAEDFAADVQLLSTVFEALHPGLYCYQTPAEFERRVRVDDRPRTLAEAWLELTRITAAIRCGHTWPSFFNQNGAVTAALLDGERCLPFAFTWLADEMVVTWSADPRLPRGVPITAVDGVPTAKILPALRELARADGGNDAKREEQLGIGITGGFEAFDILYSLRFPAAGGVRRLQLATGAEVEVTLVTKEARAAAFRPANAPTAAPFASFPKPEWRATRLGDDAVLLRMDTWAMYRETWDWRAALDAFVDRLIDQRVAHLIVDLRRNEGGNDCGDVLLARLVERPLALPRIGRFVRAAKVSTELNAVLDTWDDSFRDWGAAAHRVDAVPALLHRPASELFRLRRDADDDPDATLQPSGRRYTGRLWVLVGPANSSATFQFAQVVQRSGLGVLVGQPTGGNQRGIHGGCFFFVRLPRTGIEVDLPLIAQVPLDVVDPPDAGLRPDIAVVRTVADIANGHDAELAAVEAAIANARTAPARAGEGPAPGKRER